MPWILNSDRPIYLQLVEHLKYLIISGKFQSGDKIPSVRELAAEASVNPNTMQKALAELERENLVYTNRTSGRYITEDKTMLQTMKADLAKKEIKDFLTKMEHLGFQKDETVTILLELTKDEVPVLYH
ncbi:GntR family transcriptional regulator [Anaeromicropila populeti]|uniref:DNA-binding transcriptional regulator YhcF, GntR family n=1 Tax=Anaeromicropila populeti TaxID=37658 RepID=A0A1I6HTZ9_9FIRM|nr:GntR family transcriptional regulator [Anaeromicropila populeti]SFR57935.1 DNA-binding transcriptional regulator YhcF, GntR family [Anaeromicropila populeti]